MEEIKIAIKGNDDYPQDVIAELEKIGGINKYRFNGLATVLYYYIDTDGIIKCDNKEWIKDYFQCNNETCFYTLAEYKRMKLKAKIKSFINKIFKVKYE